MVVGNGTVGIAVEGHYAVHEVPYLLVVGMEDVCAILVDIDTFNILAIDITAQVRAFVYDKASFTHLLRTIG